MGRRAQYSIVQQTAGAVTIRDIGPWDSCLTVTNDAENVVADLLTTLGGRRLYCYDSEGELGELLIKDGLFAGFGPV